MIHVTRSRNSPEFRHRALFFQQEALKHSPDELLNENINFSVASVLTGHFLVMELMLEFSQTLHIGPKF